MSTSSTNFFGNGVTLASWERALDVLRQTKFVSDLAIAFQNINNTFAPRWTDHGQIYVFSKKPKEAIRFEVDARGDVPTSFQSYIAATISLERNPVAAVNGRPQQQQQQPPRLPPPKAQALPGP